MGQEGAEALTGRAFELHVHGLVGQSLVAVLASNQSAQHRTSGAVGVLYGEVEVHFLPVGDGTLCSSYELLVEHVVEIVLLLFGVV